MRNFEGTFMKNLGIFVLVVSFVFVAVLASVAQPIPPATPNPQAAANTPPPQPPSTLRFVPPHAPAPVPGVPYAFDLCHGGAVNVPMVAGSKNPDWAALEKDISQNQCGGPFDTRQTRVTGTDGPVHFDLAPGYGFPPLGMHLGLNGLLYGTPKPHQRLWTQAQFRVCAVTLGGYQDCHPVPFDGAPAARNSHAAAIALLGGGAAAAALGAGMAMKSSSGGSCGTPPANIFNDCFSSPQSPQCPTDIQQYNTWCKCEGYAGGFDATSGGCVQ
ncbi:exported hypothetical protein [Candidatus Sulfotelmatobacter kueseliae]|uniref:Uncharacterized protein n=1 Tax=Candidatus Sulfotelmatobacter kueseliae TaxID=2042962 RepID=A0A2U3KS57_9BACT|nr:exported hypothetical protein [Candidatus Sulfotelmatobacter kueseliae]